MKRVFTLLTWLSLAAGLVAASPNRFPNITQQELQAAITDKAVVLLDANGSRSYSAGHIPGAIDYSANRSALARVLPANKDALIVAYCGNERCGAYRAAAEAVAALGYTNIRHFSPGIAGWVKSGAPTEKPAS